MWKARAVGESSGTDRAILAAGLVLALLSGLALISATALTHTHLVQRHLFWIGLGLLIYWAVARTPYHRLADFAAVAYGVSLALLILVQVAGATRLGATRWLSVFGFSLQPSEVAKLATIWMLAYALADQPKPLPARAVGLSLAIVGLPALLIFIQPDLGSSTILLGIWFGVVWSAGLSRRWLVGFAIGGLALLPAAWHILRDYQKDRLLAFINPHADPLGAGYTIIQSIIAVGSGQLFGRGWHAGTQGQLNFLPERHSDFIFSVIAEEWGFLGSLVVVVAFGVLLGRALRIAQQARVPHGQLLAVGVFGWLAYQAIVNLGMVIGLLPVVGVPLPLVSYGGSAMVVSWAGLGLLQSIRRTDGR